MTVSVGMAVYNGQEYLAEQLDSIEKQSMQVDELIVGDDGSSDSSLNILKGFANSSKIKVSIIENERRLGFGQNFSRLLQFCSGDIVFVSDQDDVWFPKKVETVVGTLAKASEIQMVVNDQTIVDSDLTILHESALNRLKKARIKEDWYGPGCCIAVRREFLSRLLPVPKVFQSHDVWLNKVSTALGVRSILPVPLQLYRRHSHVTSPSPLSGVGKKKQIDLIKHYGLSSVEKNWILGISKTNSLISWILENEDYCTRINNRTLSVSEIVKELCKSVQAQERRIEICRKSLWIRWRFVLSHLVSGGYEHSQGWRSAVKDLIRTREDASN